MVQIAAGIAALGFDTEHDFFHGIRKTAVMLLHESYERGADKADDEVVDEYARVARQKTYARSQADGLRKRSPEQLNPGLH